MTTWACLISIVAEEAESSRKALIHFVQQVQARNRIPAHNTVIAGFSQGGILSASVALSAPECIAGFGILSGRILPELTPHIADKTRLENLRAFIGHGEFDTKLPVMWAQRSDQVLGELGAGQQIFAQVAGDFDQVCQFIRINHSSIKIIKQINIKMRLS